MDGGIEEGVANDKLAPENTVIDHQNPDHLQQNPTDAGTIVNLKWSFSLSGMLLSDGGFVREQVYLYFLFSECVAFWLF
jgi:oxalate decarboxylase